MDFRIGRCAAVDRVDFSINKRCHAHQFYCSPRRWNLMPVVDSGMLWIRSICCGRWVYFVRWPLYKCQRYTWVDAKIVIQSRHCMSPRFHSRFRSIAAEKWKIWDFLVDELTDNYSSTDKWLHMNNKHRGNDYLLSSLNGWVTRHSASEYGMNIKIRHKFIGEIRKIFTNIVACVWLV